MSFYQLDEVYIVSIIPYRSISARFESKYCFDHKGQIKYNDHQFASYPIQQSCLNPPKNYPSPGIGS